jgi:hypothetical protein
MTRRRGMRASIRCCDITWIWDPDGAK